MLKCSFCGGSVEDEHINKVVKSPIAEDVSICDKCLDKCKILMLDKSEREEARKFIRKKSRVLYKTPTAIKKQLDKYVIGQEAAKKQLCVAVYNHRKRLKDKTGLIKKSNVLMAGSSGCGKTLLAKTIADIMEVPFTIVDATTFTESGYIGDDVEICLQKLLKAAGGDIKAAQNGIVYIDEIDKISQGSVAKVSLNDGKGAGVQAAFLKLIEGNVVTFPRSGTRKNPVGEIVTFNTDNVLFICGGAFEGIHKKDEDKTFALGFNADITPTIEEDEPITTEMLVEYGMTREFIGRLPVVCELTSLTEQELIKVLTEPDNAITKEYQALFMQDGIELQFEDDALKEIASVAIKNKTGARGLRTIIEKILNDAMFMAPANDKIQKCIVTKEAVHNNSPTFKFKETAKEEYA